MASTRLLSFRVQETHYELDNPLEEPSGRWISIDKELQYAIAPWKDGNVRSGWLGKGSLKFGVIVSLLP